MYQHSNGVAAEHTDLCQASDSVTAGFTDLYQDCVPAGSLPVGHPPLEQAPAIRDSGGGPVVATQGSTYPAFEGGVGTTDKGQDVLSQVCATGKADLFQASDSGSASVGQAFLNQSVPDGYQAMYQDSGVGLVVATQAEPYQAFEGGLASTDKGQDVLSNSSAGVLATSDLGTITNVSADGKADLFQDSDSYPASDDQAVINQTGVINLDLTVRVKKPPDTIKYLLWIASCDQVSLDPPSARIKKPPDGVYGSFVVYVWKRLYSLRVEKLANWIDLIL